MEKATSSLLIEDSFSEDIATKVLALFMRFINRNQLLKIDKVCEKRK